MALALTQVYLDPQQNYSIGDQLRMGARFVEQVFDHLPSDDAGRRLKALRAKALGELHMAAAFHQFAQGQRGDTRRHVAAAIRAYPASVGNRGLLSIGLRALVASDH